MRYDLQLINLFPFRGMLVPCSLIFFLEYYSFEMYFHKEYSLKSYLESEQLKAETENFKSGDAE